MTEKGAISPQRGRRYEREWYTADEMSDLLKRTSSDAPSAVRNYALFYFLWTSGMRVSEALALRPSDVDLEHRDAYVRHGKGDKPRHVALTKKSVPPIERWIAVRSTLDLPPRATLFCSLRGTELTYPYIRSTMIRLAEGAGWTKRPHVHGLRHTYAVEAARHGVSPAFIQRQLGHTDLTITTVYLASITSDDIAEAVANLDFEG
jgi:integrase